MMSIVGAWAESTPFGPGNSTWESDDNGTFTVTLKAAGDLKSMEQTWDYGKATPWVVGSKLILIIDENVTQEVFQQIVGNDELYLLCQVPDATLAATSVSTLDLSNLTSEQAFYLNPNNQWPSQWKNAYDCNLTNIIVPSSNATSPQSYAKAEINSVGKSGSTLYFFKQSSKTVTWTDIRDSETTLKLTGEYSNNFSISDATAFTTIDLTSTTYTYTWIKVTVPTVGKEGVSLTKILVSDATMQGRILPTDATTTAAIEISGSGSGGGGDDPEPEEGSWEYKLLHHQQLTDVPTIYLTIPDVSNIDNDLKKDKSKTPWEAAYHAATMEVIDNSSADSPQHLESFTETGLQIKVRGNSTADPAKRPYRIKFDKDEKDPVTGNKIATHKHDLLGYGYKKRNWTLLANTFDATMIRNALTYHLNKAIGMDFCPGYKFVDLVINGNYRGTYQVSDHIEADKNRVNVDEDTGWMFEFARQDMTENPKFTNPIAGSIKNPDLAEMTQEDSTALHNEMVTWLQTWASKFTNDTFTSPTTGWRTYTDEESLVNFYIGINITGDYDGFMTVKSYKGTDGKMHIGPIWDKDLAYGNYSSDDGTTLVENQQNGNFRFYLKNDQNCALKDPKFVTKVKNRLDALINDGLITSLCSKVDELSTLTAQTRAKNYERWDITGTYTLNNVGKYHDWGIDEFDKYTTQLKNYLTQHITWFKEQVDAMYTSVTTSSGSITFDPTSQGDWDTGHTYTQLYSSRNTIKDLTITPRESVSGNYWSTLFLPFEYSEEQLTNLIGEYDLREFAGMDGATFRFTIPETKNINPCVPYLIKLSTANTSTSTSLAFGNVFLSLATEGETTFANGDYSVVGLLHAKGLQTNGTNFVLKSDGTLGELAAAKYVGEVSDRANVLNGTQFYFVVPSGTTPTIYIESETTPVVRTQLTTLPTIYIDTQDGVKVQSSAGEWVAAGIQVIDAKGNLKPFKQEIGLTSTGKNILQIRGRGTVSWTGTNKKSYRLQFGKDEKDEQGNVTTSYKHNLMVNEDGAGVVKKRNWVLLANSGDKTLVRNALTKEIGDAVGLPFTPGYRFVDLVLNGTYVGTYQVTEFLEADANRVNIDEDKGLLIQMTGSSDVATGDHVISGEDYTKPYLTIKNPEVKKNQDTWNTAFNSEVYDFDGMWKANDGTGLDKESLVNWYIASEIIGDYEALSSIYAYKDVNATELSFGPLWGTETAYDNNASITMTSAGLMSDLNENSTHTGLMTKAGKQSAWQTKIEGLWAQPWFANAVRLRWNTLYNNGALTTTLKEKVTTLAGIVNATDETFTTSSQAKNFTATAGGGAGWTIAGQGITNYSKSVASEATFASEVERLQGYFDTRLPYLDKKFKAMDNTVEYDVTRSDAKTYYAGYNTLTTNVILKNRGTITSSYWNPITFPFNANEDKMKEVFGNEFQLEQFSSVESQGDKVSVLKFTEVSPKAVTAGTPYLIKPASDVNLDEKTFSDVTFNSSDEGSTTDTEGYAYVGLLQPKTFSADKTHLFVGKNNTFVRLSGSATLTGARAYFTIPEAAYSKQFNLGSFDDITGISNVIIQTDADNSKIYNLNGQMVGTNWNTLPQGVYIVNGKKIVK